MSKVITLKKPITMAAAIPGGDQQIWKALTLRDIEAGDICDAGRELPDSASQTEMQLRVAGKCCDLPFVIIRKLSPVDMVQIETWWQEQWAGGTASDEEADPDDNPFSVGEMLPAS